MKKTRVGIIALLFASLGASIALFLMQRAPAVPMDAILRALLAVSLLACVFMTVAKSKQREPSGVTPKFDANCASSQTTFADVAANEEARKNLQGLADYLKDPEKYAKLGARMPRGVLLYGPPGTGKTLLARALAGEAGVPFFALSGSDFVQMYVGVGASRVRDLFQKAKKAGRCVIFIDEIDAMGKRRDDSASEEREQTLNALLSEMSGFHPNDGTIVLAATNRLDTLDPALTRPGRFDRKIEVGLPGRDERLQILKLHARNKPLDEEIDLEALAGDTVFFSGASLESMLNDAAIRAARRGASAIERIDLDAAYLTSVAGEDKRAAASQEERPVIALHEAGHALATYLLMPDQPIRRVSILPTSGGAAGYSLSIPKERAVLGKARLESQIQVLLAGRAAELLIGGEREVTSGAANDLQRAAELASSMVMDLGMAGEPGVALRSLSKCGSAPDALAKSRALLSEQFNAITDLLGRHVEKLMSLTQELLERETLKGEDVSRVLN